jgi:hypothetical protein
MAINTELLRQARQSVAQLNKFAFVAAGDPAMGAPPPGGDPAAGGAPMDPSMAGGAPMDPSMAGGAPPAGGGDPMAAIMPMIQQAVQQAMAANGGGAGGGLQGAGPGLKPKIDVNVEIMQIKKMLAKIVDAMGIHIPAQDMVATPEDLNQIAQGGAGYAAATPDNGGQGGGGLGQISPIQPMKAAAAEWESGVAFTPPSEFSLNRAHETTRNNANLAAALVMRKRVGA